jgi:DNA repair protein RecO (recombination protein O)
MEETKNTTALILNRQPYRESDTLVTVYTPDYGKLSLIARGTQKLQSKLAGHLEPLTLADIMIIKGKGRDYIGSARSREVYLGLRGDLNKLYYAGQVINIFNRLIRDSQADPRLFFLLAEVIDGLDNLVSFTKETGQLILAIFIFKLSEELGYQPGLCHCLRCGEEIKPGQNYFNLADGGLSCGNCREQQRQPDGSIEANLLAISDNTLKVLRFIRDNSFSRATKIKVDKKLIKELSSVADKFLQYHF